MYTLWVTDEHGGCAVEATYRIDIGEWGVMRCAAHDSPIGHGQTLESAMQDFLRRWHDEKGER